MAACTLLPGMLAAQGTESSDATPHCTAQSEAVTAITGTPSAELISDCNILMDASAVLRGVSEADPLNWSADLAMDRWTGIEISGERVTKLDSELDDEQTIFSNTLQGVLPPSLGNLSALTVLRLNNTALRGEIPAQLGDLAELTVLDLGAQRCFFVWCGGLEGSIPSSLGNLRRLEVLNLGYNKLDGEVPLSLRNLTALRVLDLSDNVDYNMLEIPLIPATGLQGELPTAVLKELGNLEELVLDFNRFTGTIPRELGKLQALTKLDLQRNFLTGCIPGSLRRFGVNPQRNTNNLRARNLPVCPAPDRPVARVVSAVGNEVVVAYRADGGEPVSRFEYRLSADRGSTWDPDWTAIPDSAPGGANADSFTIGGLTEGTTYTVELRAVNVDGTGSETSITATLQAYPAAALRDLVLRHGAGGVTLSQTFAFDRFSYTVMVGHSVDVLTVVATPANTSARVSSDPEDGDDGVEGIQIRLDVGINIITLTVTAGNGDRQVYRLTVIRNPTDEPAGVTTQPAELALDEGTTASYTVVLAAEPVEAVTVGVRLSGSRSVRASPSRLMFQTSDWQTPQTVTVYALTDADDADESARLSHFATGAGYDTLSMPVVMVTARDDNASWVPSFVKVEAQAGSANLVLVYDRKLDESRVPVPEDFEVTLNDEVVAVESVTVSGTRVTLVLERALQGGVQIAVRVTQGVIQGIPEVGSDRPMERVLLFESASNPNRQGFVRIINHSDEDGLVRITAVDDAGVRSASVSLDIDPGAAAHFNANDLEDGNADKGLTDGIGSGSLGDWRLEITTELDIEVLSYARTTDGFVTSLHDSVAVGPGAPGEAVFFNPGKNVNQVSRLRLVNAATSNATVTVQGTDDAGMSSGEVRIEVYPGTSVDLTAADLESGVGQGILSGALGTGTGKWRLSIASNVPVTAMSLLESEGRLTNLSTAVQTEGSVADSILVPLFPSASAELAGFVRVINRSDEAGEVRIAAFDDTDRDYDPVTLSLEANETRHFNSEDVEMGNADKKLTGSTGAGEGDWRLELSSDLDIEVLAYIRTDVGFVTAMHDLAPVADDVHRVVFLNPGKNQAQVSRIRLVNPGATDATVTITGIDSAGESPGDPVQATVSAGRSLELTAQELESGESDSIDSGALGTGQGKWRLHVESDQAIHVMSLLNSPTGHLTNLSTSPGGS